MNEDVLRQILDHSLQPEVASLAQTSRWFRSLAFGVLYANPQTRTMRAAMLLCQRLHASQSDASLNSRVKSLSFYTLGATDICTKAQWEMLEATLASALNSPACVILERITVELSLPTVTTWRSSWGTVVWDALRVSCPMLQHVHITHRTSRMAKLPPLARLPGLKSLVLTGHAALTDHYNDLTMERFFRPLTKLSPTLRYLHLVLCGPSVDVFFRSGPWPELSRLHLKWIWHNPDGSHIARFLDCHPKLRYVLLRGNTTGLLKLAEFNVLDLHTLDTNDTIARDLLYHPACSVRHLKLLLDVDLDSFLDGLESIKQDTLATLDIRLRDHNLRSGLSPLVSRQALRAIGKFAPCLQELVFRGQFVLEMDWSAFCDILSTFQQLRIVGLPSFASLRPGSTLECVVNDLVACLPLLRMVNLTANQENDHLVTVTRIGDVLVRTTQTQAASSAIQHLQLDATSRLHP